MATPPVKDHEVRNTVTDLCAVAVRCHATQQLRANIQHALFPLLARFGWPPANTTPPAPQAMPPVTRYDGFYRHFDGMCWPAPSQAMHDVAYALIHTQTDELKSERLLAASVIAAYAELVRLPERERNARIRELRKSTAIADDRKLRGGE